MAKNRIPVKNRVLYRILLIVIISLLLILGIRLTTPEDTWICQNNQWVKHGSPDVTMPQTVCK